MSLGTVTPGMLGSSGGGGAPVPEWGASKHLVRWYTPWGALVGSRWVDDGGSVAHPAPPTIPGLTFDSWAGPATNVVDDHSIIGVWVPTDGKLHIHVVADAINGLTPTLKLSKTDTSTLLVEWGDGTTSTTSVSGNVTLVKPAPYASGSYEIQASITVGAGFYNLGHGTTGNGLVAGVMVQEVWLPAVQMLSTIPAFAFSGVAFRTMEALVGARNATSVGASAFADNRALDYVALPLVTNINSSGFVNAHSLRKVIAPVLTAIGNNAFENAFSLEELYAPSMNFTGTASLQNCHALPGLTRSGNALTSLGSSTFKFGYNVRYLDLPLVPAIPATAFDAARTLRDIVIGPLCTSIGLNAFVGNYDLRRMRLQATTPPTLASVGSISGHSELLVIEVPAASLAAYQAATNWSAFAARMVGY